MVAAFVVVVGVVALPAPVEVAAAIVDEEEAEAGPAPPPPPVVGGPAALSVVPSAAVARLDDASERRLSDFEEEVPLMGAAFAPSDKNICG
jgi:hypothetical protein